jgi:hypothetical protein
MKTICLNMIVKNEKISTNLCDKIKFDCLVISDIVSLDKTPNIIEH